MQYFGSVSHLPFTKDDLAAKTAYFIVLGCSSGIQNAWCVTGGTKKIQNLNPPLLSWSGSCSIASIYRKNSTPQKAQH